MFHLQITHVCYPPLGRLAKGLGFSFFSTNTSGEPGVEPPSLGFTDDRVGVGAARQSFEATQHTLNSEPEVWE